MNISDRHREWTSADVRDLRSLAKKKLSARIIGQRLKRTTGAVKYKAMTLSVRLRAINQPKGAQIKAQRTIKANARKRSLAAKKGAATKRAARPMVSQHAL